MNREDWTPWKAMPRPIALGVLFVVAVAWVVPAEAATPRRYELEVGIEPDRRQVSVSGRVSVQVTEDESTFSFDLHRTFRIVQCTINSEPARCEPAEPAGTSGISRRIAVHVPDSVPRGEVDLEIRYHGVLQDRPSWGEPDAEGPFMDDAAGPDRVELAVYSSWYPSFGFGSTYGVDLDVTLPRGWGVACIGGGVDDGGETAEETRTRTRCAAQAVNDLVIVASPRLRHEDVATAAGRVRVYHTRLPEPFLVRMARETEQTLLLFSKLLGEGSSGGVLQHVYSPRERGQGFARPGMIIVSEGRTLGALAEDPDASFLYGDAHEAGHFWWRFGSGQGDWINEAFAEYFALVAVQSIQGEDAFQEGLATRRKDVRELPADAPAIAQAPASNDGPGYTIKYHKGALMLDAFRSQMGDERFFDACRRFYASIRDTRAGTDDFRFLWKAALRDDELLTSWLDSGGSAPVPPVD